MNFHKASTSTGFESLFELGVRLPWKADDDVRGECRIISQHIATLIQTFQEPVNSITSTHAFKDGIGAALQSGMELWAQVFAVSSGFDEVVVDFDRFDAGQPHSPVTRNAVQATEQIPQSFGIIAIG